MENERGFPRRKTNSLELTEFNVKTAHRDKTRFRKETTTTSSSYSLSCSHEEKQTHANTRVHIHAGLNPVRIPISPPPVSHILLLKTLHYSFSHSNSPTTADLSKKRCLRYSNQFQYSRHKKYLLGSLLTTWNACSMSWALCWKVLVIKGQVCTKCTQVSDRDTTCNALGADWKSMRNKSSRVFCYEHTAYYSV